MSGWVCVQIMILFSGFVSISLFLSSSIMSSSCLNVPLTISNSYMYLSYKHMVELFTSFTSVYLVLIKSSYSCIPKCNTHFLRLVLKAFKQLSYPWLSFQSLDTTKMSSRFTPDSLIACPTSNSFLQHSRKLFVPFIHDLRKLTLLYCLTLIPLY